MQLLVGQKGEFDRSKISKSHLWNTHSRYTQLTRFVARGLWVLLAMPTLSEDFKSS